VITPGGKRPFDLPLMTGSVEHRMLTIAINRDGHHFMTTSIDNDALLRRTQLAAALTASGFPVAPASLATWVSRGGGPPFRKFGRVVLYKWSDALEWAEARMTAPRRTTSEVDAVKDGTAAEV
jgi:hypothetical protein